MTTLPGKSPSSRRASISSSTGSPMRQRRASLSIASPPSPSMPLAAAASINAGMRSGSPGPAMTAKDSAASRRSSVAVELALADDKLPPPAEIASSDRRGSLSEGQFPSSATGTRLSSINTQSSTSGSPFAGAQGAHGDLFSNSLTGSPVDPFKSGALRDPMTGVASGDGLPQHHRTPSISQVHQQMEQEQEAQVNRLLVTIHQQQTQIDKLQRQLESTSSATSDNASLAMTQPHLEPGYSPSDRAPSVSSHLGTATPGIDFPPAPTPQRAHSSSSAGTTVASTMPAGRVSPTLSSSQQSTGKMPSTLHMPFPQHHHRISLGSRSSSRAASPSVRSSAGTGTGHLENDELKYWRSEAENLIKENDILKQRIKELEKDMGDTTVS